jgi:hypothetical protein
MCIGVALWVPGKRRQSATCPTPYRNVLSSGTQVFGRGVTEVSPTLGHSGEGEDPLSGNDPLQRVFAAFQQSEGNTLELVYYDELVAKL